MTESQAGTIPFWNAFRSSPGKAREVSCLKSVHERAAAFLNSSVLPNAKDENWRYTDLRILSRCNFSLLEGLGVEVGQRSGELLSPSFINIRCLNGFFPTQDMPRDLPPGIAILTGEPAMAAACDVAYAVLTNNDSELLIRLNDLHSNDLLLVDVSRGVELDRPIHIVYVFDEQARGKAVFPRVLVRMAQGAKVKIFESTVASGEQPILINSVLDIHMAPESELEIVQACRNTSEIIRFMSTRVSQEKDSRLRAFLYTDGARIFRHNLSVLLKGEGAETVLNGLHRLSGARHADSHTFVEHIAPNAKSNQLYKTVLDGEARSVFNGRILVRKDAQLTNSYQLNKNLLLSRDARVDTKPQLEIFADDVKCSHGATIGQLDEEQLFYIGTRGIGKDAAVNMLIRGFIDDVVGLVSDKLLRDKLIQTMD